MSSLHVIRLWAGFRKPPTSRESLNQPGPLLTRQATSTQAAAHSGMGHKADTRAPISRHEWVLGQFTA